MSKALYTLLLIISSLYIVSCKDKLPQATHLEEEVTKIMAEPPLLKVLM